MPRIALRLIAVSSLAAALSAASATFIARTIYPQSYYANTILPADYNKDGIVDLLVLGQDTPAYAMWFGNGDGTFRQFGPIYNKNATGCGAHGGLNLDGREDVVYCAAGRKLAVMLGNGDGTFSTSSVSLQGVPHGVVIADLNGDGKPDLAIATTLGASVLLGAGDGTFSAETLLPGQYQGNSLTAADFNRDGHTDLAVSQISGVVLYLGDGHGSFPTQRNIPVGAGATQILAADFNGDGIPDLAFNCLSSLDGILLGRGDGTFQTPTYYGGGPGLGLATGMWMAMGSSTSFFPTVPRLSVYQSSTVSGTAHSPALPM